VPRGRSHGDAVSAAARRSDVLTVRNEFAAVEVSLDDDGQSPRLRLHDVESGREAFLDAMLLRTLVSACRDREVIARLLAEAIPREPDSEHSIFT
jgi:hypothetical protein